MKSGLKWAWIGCAVVSLLPLWTVRYIPSIDLPQHAAQISIIKNLNNPAFGFAPYYELHLFIPYAFVYLLGVAFSYLFTIDVAIKILLSVALLGLPFSLHLLLREMGGDPWLALIGFPLSYNYSFHWGFLSFTFAVPIAVLFVASMVTYIRVPSIRRGVTASLLCVVLFFSHGLAFGVGMAIAGVLCLCHLVENPRQAILNSLPLLAAVPLVIYWYAVPQNEVPNVQTYTEWADPGFLRLRQLPYMLLSNWDDRYGAATGILIILAVFLRGALTFRPFHRTIPFLVSLLFFLFTPHHTMDISLIYQRFAVFVVVFSVMLIQPSWSNIKTALSRGIIILAVIGWSILELYRFQGFDREMQDFDKAAQSMEQGRSILNLMFDSGSNFASWESNNHMAAWKQAENGGAYSFSFAFSYKSVARYKKDAAPLPADTAGGLGNPDSFNWESHGVFDYYVVRAFKERTDALFGKAPAGAVKLVGHEGPWWVYRRMS